MSANITSLGLEVGKACGAAVTAATDGGAAAPYTVDTAPASGVLNVTGLDMPYEASNGTLVSGQRVGTGEKRVCDCVASPAACGRAWRALAGGRGAGPARQAARAGSAAGADRARTRQVCLTLAAPCATLEALCAYGGGAACGAWVMVLARGARAPAPASPACGAAGLLLRKRRARLCAPSPPPS